MTHKTFLPFLGVILGLLILPHFSFAEPKICVPGKEPELKVKVEKVWEKGFSEFQRAFLAENGTVILEFAKEDKKGRLSNTTRVAYYDQAGNQLMEKAIPGWSMIQYAPGQGKYFIMSDAPFGGEHEGKCTKYDAKGNVVWKASYLEGAMMVFSPDGEYTGVSGLFNEDFLSTMGWFELRDKDYKLVWKHEPKERFGAVVLNGGRVISVEGSTVRLLERGGRVLKQIVIPEIGSLPHGHQFGYITPSGMTGPAAVTATEDGRYVAFRVRKNKVWDLYSVNLEKGTWWSKKAVDDPRFNIELAPDGGRLLANSGGFVFVFDNHNGALLAEHRQQTYKQQLGGGQFTSGLGWDGGSLFHKYVLSQWGGSGRVYRLMLSDEQCRQAIIDEGGNSLTDGQKYVFVFRPADGIWTPNRRPGKMKLLRVQPIE